MSVYSLRRSRHIFRTAFALYKKKYSKLKEHERTALEDDLQQLDAALVEKDREKADEYAKKVESYTKFRLRKSLFDHMLELLFAMFFALIAAAIIRQMWFEPYEIPTGSMRPTFKEKDRLIVTKTNFGLNVPLKPMHLYLDPDLINRMGIITFTVENVDVPNPDTTYFGIFPSKKRYIKRLIAKPDDTIYFYGGKIYAIDNENNDLIEVREDPYLDKIEHIPFMNFDGKISVTPSSNPLIHSLTTIRLMNIPISEIELRSNGVIKGTLFQDHFQNYYDIWGIQNYAMARIITKEQASFIDYIDISTLEKTDLYLELSHSPEIPTHASVVHKSRTGNLPYIAPVPHKTLIPLHQRHLDELMNSMYTSRFVVKDGRATSYNGNNPRFSSFSPFFLEVGNGVYEFFHGTAYKIGFAGMTETLPDNHPLYSTSPSHIQRLFNMGIEMLTIFDPGAGITDKFPSRYAYFRNGDLYCMGAPLITKDDTTLKSFITREHHRHHNNKRYVPFLDHGPPLTTDGAIDVDFIKRYGLHIPEGMYLVLGDNHAQSADGPGEVQAGA